MWTTKTANKRNIEKPKDSTTNKQKAFSYITTAQLLRKFDIDMVLLTKFANFLEIYGLPILSTKEILKNLKILLLTNIEELERLSKDCFQTQDTRLKF